MRGKLKTTKHPGVFRRSDGAIVLRAKGCDEKTGRQRELTKILPPETTPAAALAALGELKDAVRRGAPTATPAAEVPSVTDYAEPWSERRLARGKWNAHGSTPGSVAYRLERYVLPALGDFLVSKVTFADVAAWLDRMTAEGLAPTTIGPIYCHLRGLLADARLDVGLPPFGAWPEAPRMPKRSADTLTWENYDKLGRRALTREQLRTFLETAKRLDAEGWYPMAVLGFGSDGRYSEICAARVDDFDLSGEVGVWLVRRHFVHNRNAIAPGAKCHPEGLVRVLDPVTTATLRPYLAGKLPGAMLFPPFAFDAVVRRLQSFQKFLDRISAATKLPRMSSKIMRETYLTLSSMQNMVDALTMAQAGHSSPDVTATYVRPTVEHRREHAKKMAEVLYLPAGTAKPAEK